jgi:hypothetical protein
VSYGLVTTRSGVEATVSAKDRSELFHDALAAALEVSYSGVPAQGDYEGQVVPIQGVGFDDLQILRDLLDDCLTAVHETSGTLHPPRWISFDDDRVTANLPSTTPRTPARGVTAKRVEPAASDAPFSARVVFQLEEAH